MVNFVLSISILILWNLMDDLIISFTLDFYALIIYIVVKKAMLLYYHTI